MKKYEVEYIDEEHIYLINGIITKSVTQLLQSLFPDKYEGIPIEILENKASYGNKVHELIENMEQNKIFKPELFATSTLIETSLNEYLRLKKENGLKVIKQEEIINYLDLYAGRYDILGKVNGELSLVDIKTTAILDEEYLSWQLSLYAYAIEEDIKKIYCLWLPKGKRGRFVEIERKCNEEIERFLEKGEQKNE